MLYICRTRPCVVAELQPFGERQAVGVEGLLPRHLYRYEIRLEHVLDLTDAGVRAEVGRGVEVLTGPDPAACQDVGATAHALGVQAILSPSAAGVDDVLAVFVQRIRLGTVEPNLVAEWHTSQTWRGADGQPRPGSCGACWRPGDQSGCAGHESESTYRTLNRTKPAELMEVEHENAVHSNCARTICREIWRQPIGVYPRARTAAETASTHVVESGNPLSSRPFRSSHRLLALERLGALHGEEVGPGSECQNWDRIPSFLRNWTDPGGKRAAPTVGPNRPWRGDRDR